MTFKVGDRVMVRAGGHTYCGRPYASEATAGSIGTVVDFPDTTDTNSTVHVRWISHPVGFDGRTASFADEDCLFLYQDLDVSSIGNVEEFLNG